MARGKSHKTTARQPKHRSAKQTWFRRIVVGLLLVVVVFAAVFSWNRWFRFDDAADMRGEWKLAEASMTIVIDDYTMRLTRDVSYAYTLDTWAKTITFSFGNLKGGGLYAFSDDRKTLVIAEGRTPDIASVLGLIDISQDSAKSNVVKDGTGETSRATLAGTSIFTKLSDSTEASPQSLTNNTTQDANTVGAAIVSGEDRQASRDTVVEPEVVDPDAGVPASESQENAVDSGGAIEEGVASDATGEGEL
ncbi:MAG: hypothetical protein RR955_03375 [Raoultibacter sp.]